MKAKRAYIQTRNILLYSFLLLLACPNARHADTLLKRDGNLLFFYQEKSDARHPMLLNIPVSFAAAKNRWGILYKVSYRKTGFGVLNRTRFTSVLYFSVVDGNLRELTKRPLVLHKSKANFRSHVLEAENRWYIAFTTKKNQLQCLEFNPQKLTLTGRKFSISQADKILKTATSMSKLALAYSKNRLYALSYDSGLKLLWSNDKGKHGSQLIIEPKQDRLVKTADLRIIDSNAHILWSETSSKCQGRKNCTVFYYARCSLKNQKCSFQKISINGNSSKTIKTEFLKSGTSYAGFLQYGNRIWKQSFHGNFGRPLPPKHVFSMKNNPSPSPALFACTDHECLIFFQKADGAYSYSKKSGRKKAAGIAFRQAVKCSASRCIQKTADGSISFFNPQ